MRKRRWYTHRTVVFLATAGALWVVWFGYSNAGAQHKTDPALLAAMAARQPVNMWAELPFKPEEFHIRYMQDRGTVTGVQGHWIHLSRVPPASAWAIARQYWVQRLRAEPGPGASATS